MTETVALPTATLQRVEQRVGDAEFGGAGVIGALTTLRGPCLSTLELPWRNNRDFNSCILAGEYVAVPRIATKKFPYQHFILRAVPERDYILIHSGNYPRDTEGCILVGMTADAKRPAVWNSRRALRKLREWAPHGFRLRVERIPAPPALGG